MKIVVCKDYDDVSRVMAEKVVEQIRKNLIWYSVCLRGTLLSGCTNILFRCTKRERLISHS